MVAVPGLTVQGYDGVLDEVGFASIIGRGAGLPHAVSAVGAWQVSAVANVDRTIAVAVGTGFAVCGGVRATGSGSVTAQLPTITTGSRWDLVAALFDWTFSDANKNGTVTIEVVTGGSSIALPGQLATSLGSRFHMPLALVQVVAGRQTPAQIIDLRVRNKGGLATVSSAAALSVYRAAEPLEFDALIDERGPDLPLLSNMQADLSAASSVAAANSLARRDGTGALSVGVPTQGAHAARLTDLNTIGSRVVGSPSRALLLAGNRGNQAPSGGYIVGHFEQDSSTNQLSSGFGFVRGADGVQRVSCTAAGVYFIHGEVTMSSQAAHTAGIRLSGTWGRAGTQIPSPAGGQTRPTFSEIVLMPAGGVVSLTVSNNATHQFVSAALDITRIL